ncbi:radical SAM family heme chaperone HemW [Commensalibacter oyaizuii]|uniref:Heme chaperone HemW n=1 Tax=Commensalibacter oyaizuii TaxID=3043873 RepID=A0ABT6Q374_9PROT|nr:radical SAM family heme chaperone HemW [Commensalibacter sp. TBRC 16381]MDI2091557.1 radical SAM family heme chaperone HemW [Commensalibacter sp. TBRC 16381]
MHPSLQSNQGIALYIHWPFCLAKCPYCDFNSHVTKTIPQDDYAKALLQELKTALALTHNRILTSIFFGGGTPSLMAPTTVQQLIECATKNLPVADQLEITLEANPTSVENQKLKDFQQAGVNRISLGIQSLNPVALKALGREHTVGQAIEALSLAKKLFHRVSFDLIYAREGQTLSQWETELDEALALANDHLSLYQLTIESGTLFAKQYQQGKLHLPDEITSSELLQMTDSVTNRHGLAAYEISNYAKPGSESKHNLAYWRYQDYIGIGPGAHGRVTIDHNLYATERYKNPQKWLISVQENGHALCHQELLSCMDKAYEMLLMGLRLTEGVKASLFEERCGIPILDAINVSMLTALIEEDYLLWDQTYLKTTAKGKIRLNAILEALLK